MKKALCICLGAILTLGLMACSRQTAPQVSPSPTPSVSPSPTVAPEPDNDANQGGGAGTGVDDNAIIDENRPDGQSGGVMDNMENAAGDLVEGAGNAIDDAARGIGNAARNIMR